MAARVHDCVGALIVDGERVLLGLRSDDCDWLPGAWDVFGGHVEPGESGEQALARELDEELGIAPLRAHYLDCIEGGADEPWRLRLYLVTAWTGTPHNRDAGEHAVIEWTALADAQRRLAGAHARLPALLAVAVGAAAARPARP